MKPLKKGADGERLKNMEEIQQPSGNNCSSFKPLCQGRKTQASAPPPAVA